LELFDLLIVGFRQIVVYKQLILYLLISCLILFGVYQIDGPHRTFIQNSEKQFLWGCYWIWLGILSSVGLGTGLHTFLLFLGPFIAKVTLAAYECNSTNFKEPPYPDEVICSDDITDSGPVTMWDIMSKVRFPAFCWGAGTALGELPPYFMARAARLSGRTEDNDEEFQEFQALLESQANGTLDKKKLDMMTRAKLFMHAVIEKVGFFGILAAASIPNPLFDLAGITCGHFLVPFWTFFGATLIGKAVIKMHIQKIFIIFTFSKHLVENLLLVIQVIPVIGGSLHHMIQKMLEKQQKKLHSGSNEDDNGNFIGQFFEIFVFAMVAYFVVTIINSLAQARFDRKQKEKRDLKLN